MELHSKLKLPWVIGRRCNAVIGVSPGPLTECVHVAIVRRGRCLVELIEQVKALGDEIELDPIGKVE